MEPESSKAEAKDSANDEDDDDEEEEEDGPHKGDADEGSSTSRLGAENMKQEGDEEQESKDNSG